MLDALSDDAIKQKVGLSFHKPSIVTLLLSSSNIELIHYNESMTPVSVTETCCDVL